MGPSTSLRRHTRTTTTVDSTPTQPDVAPPAASVPLGKRLLVLLLVQLVLAIVAIPLAYLAGGDMTTAGLAWLACFVGTIGGHLASEYPAGNEYALLRLAAGMACRTILPMGFAAWAAKIKEPPVDQPAMAVLIFAYLVGLVADSMLSIQRLKPVMGNSN